MLESLGTYGFGKALGMDTGRGAMIQTPELD